MVALIRAGTGACPYKFLRLNRYQRPSLLAVISKHSTRRAECPVRVRLIQPIFLFEFLGEVGFGQVLKVLVGEGVELVLETY